MAEDTGMVCNNNNQFLRVSRIHYIVEERKLGGRGKTHFVLLPLTFSQLPCSLVISNQE